MDNDIHLISDGDGVAIIGDPATVERFLISEGLPSKELSLNRLRPALNHASTATQAASEMAANSGRWVKLTEKSAAAVKKLDLMKDSTANVSRAVATKDGKIAEILEFTSKGRGMLTNPALLTGAAGIMAQMAMQQAMDEVTEYLATIDEKVDDILQAQTDAVVADMLAVGMNIDEAMALREGVGRVSEVTWSKVQGTSETIARTQAYALRQLDGLAKKLESKSKIGDLAKASQDADAKVQQWLAVLARCSQLQDGLAVLELDRVFDSSPEDLDQHRLALRSARTKRLDTIGRSTDHLLARLNIAAARANAKVLLNPTTSHIVVESNNHVVAEVADFRERLGIEHSQESLEARRWVEAATDVRDKVLETGGEGVSAAKRFSEKTREGASSLRDKVASGIGKRTHRRSADESPDVEDQIGTTDVPREN